MTRVVEWEAGAASLGQTVLAIGVFDGVHIGHRTLLADTVRLAAERGVKAAALTFDRDPDQVVTPATAAPQLLSLDDKLRFMCDTDLDAVLVVPFCMRMAEMVPDRFLDDVLSEASDPVAVVVGQDFRFGTHASGTVATLQEYGSHAGFEVVAHELVTVGGAPVTSTRIRGLVAEGDVAGAAALLGRWHRLEGRVGHGRGEGAPLLGVPTANIQPHAYAALPADGVYAGYAMVDEVRHPAAISVGLPPSFPEARDTLEAHLLDWEGDLYAHEVTLEFVERLRAQEAFDHNNELAARIHEDIARTRGVLANAKGI